MLRSGRFGTANGRDIGSDFFRCFVNCVGCNFSSLLRFGFFLLGPFFGFTLKTLLCCLLYTSDAADE